MKILYRSLGFVTVLALSTLFTSCDKVKDLVTINVPLQTADVKFTIEPVAAGNIQHATFQWGINIDSVLKKENADLGIGNIKKVKVKSITLNLTNATQTDNWASFSAAEAGFASNAISPISYITFASKASNPDTYATTLDLSVNSDVDLKDHFGATIFYYKVSATARRATTTALEGTATIKFDIEAGL
jgi:hypothetical protein